MLRRGLIVGAALLALLCEVGSPAQAQARHFIGRANSGARFSPWIRSGFSGYGRRYFDRSFGYHGVAGSTVSQNEFYVGL